MKKNKNNSINNDLKNFETEDVNPINENINTEKKHDGEKNLNNEQKDAIEDLNEELKEDKDKVETDEVDSLKIELEQMKKKSEENYDLAMRIAAEFDNYKKRTVKEKQALYKDSVCDTLEQFLPVLDNFERALKSSESEDNFNSLKEGVQLVLKQYKEVLKNIGIEEINDEGKAFDPNLHNAVMHIDDEAYGENIIVEVFQKGYLYKDKVIRHSMVKVAN